MSPIFIRPQREQSEHDRLIRHLQLKYKRKFEVAINVGEEQLAPVKIGALTLFPDLVLTTGKKLAGLVEVESGESVNNLEAMAQWVHFSRARVPFHLYVPVHMYEAARRLCEAHRAAPTEVWTYRPAADGFDLVRMVIEPITRASRALKPLFPEKPVVPAPAPTPPAKPAAPVKAKPVAKAPVAVAKAAAKAPKPTRAAKQKPAVKAGRSRPAAAAKKTAPHPRAKVVAKRKR